MAMKIYFGNSQTPVDGDGVYYLGREETLFSDYFKLGSASACEYIFEFDKSMGYDGQVIRVFDDSDTLIATVSPMEIDDSADDIVKVTAYDNMVKFDFPYDASSLIMSPEGGEEEGDEPIEPIEPITQSSGDDEERDITPVTLMEILEDMCSQAGVELATEHLYMADETTDLMTMMVDWYDNTYTARQYIGMIAEMYGGFAYITADGSLDFRLFDDDGVDIEVDDCSSFEVGELHEITRVYWGESHYYPLDYADGDDLIVDMNNLFMGDNVVLSDNTELGLDDLLANIYSRVGGLEFCSVTVDDLPVPEVRAGTMAWFTDGESNVFPTIWAVKQEYVGQWVGGLKVKFGKAEQGVSQAYNSMIQNIRTIKTLVDRTNASLTILARESGANSDKVAQLQVDVDGIRSSVSSLSSGLDEIITSKIEQSATNLMIEFTTQIQNAVNGLSNEWTTYIRFDSDGVTIGKITDDPNENPIFGRFGNQKLSFQNQSGTIEYAWLDAENGLGAPKVSIGDPNNVSRRWQIITSAVGDHLRFTRHS